MKKIKNMFEKHDLFKILLFVILFIIIFSWIIPVGSFTGSEYTRSGYARIGLADIGASGIYAVNFFLQQMLFILFIGITYGILSKISGYQAMVSSLAKKLMGKEKIFVLSSSIFVGLLTSILTQSFIVLLFVPFLIHVASKLKLDKLTIFLCTFGSMLIGTLGATFGTEGLLYFINYLNYYSKMDVTTEIGIRFGFLALTLVVVNFFTIRHMMNVAETKKKDEKETNDFLIIEEPKEKNVKVWPMALFFLLTFIFTILGYVDWYGDFEITIFNNFHTWLTNLSIGKYNVVQYILGNEIKAFGEWELYSILFILLLFLLPSIFIYKVKWNDLFDSAIDGLKKIMKPLLLVTLIYTVFVYIYWSPMTITIAHWILNIAEGFNPFLTSLVAGITSLFHIDFGYTGYALGSVLSTYGEQAQIAFVIYVAIHGLVLFVAPTSIFLTFGLSYLDIPYKKWMKHIWKAIVILLIFLLVIFTLVSYI